MLLIANFVKTLSNCCGYGLIKMGEEMQTCFCSLPVAWRDVACLSSLLRENVDVSDAAMTILFFARDLHAHA